jgi:uncharacterized membrane protein YphA (DoxX/SURF4 family)
MAHRLIVESTDAPVVAPRVVTVERRASHGAFATLHFGYAVLPILAGLDKFFNVLVNWEQYLAPRMAEIIPLSATAFMQVVGAIEIAAGLLVAIRPRIGAYVVMGWLWAIIVNLLMVPGYYDIALRDFGLSLGALALARLAREHDRPFIESREHGV